MSEAVFDRGAFLPDPFTEWYHGRPFQVAFVVSLLVHAVLIVLVPGLRSVNIEPEQVISVEILMPEARPVAEPELVPPAPTFTLPVPQQRPIEQQVTRPQPQLEPLPEPIVRQTEPELPPVARAELTPPVPQQRPVEQQIVRPQPVEPLLEPIVRQPEPELPPVARAELAPPVPRQEPRPEPLAVEPPLPRPAPPIAPTIEPMPVPQVVEPRIEPRPIAPRPQPQIQPRVAPRPEPAPQPPMEVQPQLSQPVPPRPAPVAPTVSQPRPLEAIVPPPDQPAPPSVAAIQPPPAVAAPVPPAPPRPAIDESRLMQTYGTEISREIRRYQRYPVVAQRRGWEGTAEVTLRIAADGSVVSIELGKSSGREILDTEALNMVRRATPLPQAPDNLRGRELNVTVPIVFRLQDS